MRKLSRNRRTLLGAALATASLAAPRPGASGKHKNKKCKAPTTKCGKKHCCLPGQTCVGGICQAASTTSTTPAPFTAVTCSGAVGANISGRRRYAQPFVASGTRKIAKASFTLLNIGADTPLGVQIRTTQNGAPTTQVLGTAILMDIEPVTLGVDPPEQVTAAFQPTVPVTQGVTYALVITNLVNNGIELAASELGACPLRCYLGVGDTNTFEPNPDDVSLLFTISP